MFSLFFNIIDLCLEQIRILSSNSKDGTLTNGSRIDGVTYVSCKIKLSLMVRVPISVTGMGELFAALTLNPTGEQEVMDER